MVLEEENDNEPKISVKDENIKENKNEDKEENKGKMIDIIKENSEIKVESNNNPNYVEMNTNNEKDDKDIKEIDNKKIEDYLSADNEKNGEKVYSERIKKSDREQWVDLAYRISYPVLDNMSKGLLKKNMEVEYSPVFDTRDRKVLYLECFGRLMDGISPWLTLPDDNTKEGKIRKKLRE